VLKSKQTVKVKNMSSAYYNRITLCGDREQVTATIAFNREAQEESSDDNTSESEFEHDDNVSDEEDSNHQCKRKKLMPTSNPSRVIVQRKSHTGDGLANSEAMSRRVTEAGRDIPSDYIKRINKVVQENAKEEFTERKKMYEKLVKDKEYAETQMKAIGQEVALDSSKLQKHEEDIQIWKNSIFNTSQKIEFLDEEIHELDEKLQSLKSKRLELSLDKRSFEGIVQEKSVKSRILKQQIDLSKEEIEKSRQRVEMIKDKIDNVFKSKASSATESDPFLSHLEKQISQKTTELECPVCFIVCQPPILRCPEFHLVCGECWPRMRVCGECRAPYEGRMRHRYAERGHQELQDLIRTREEHINKK